MKASELASLWAAPDNSRLTAKQYSLRLPIHVAAKINALCDLYPNKNRTQIVGDLLASALTELEQALPYEESDYPIHYDEHDNPIHEMRGVRARFGELARQYERELEQEAGKG